MSYQIRDGKLQCGYYGTGPTLEEYQNMHDYLDMKKEIVHLRQLQVV